MNYLISGVINFLTWIILGLIVFSSNPKGKLNRSFALLSLSIAFWAFGYIFWQSYQHLSPNPEKALFWARFLMLWAIIIPVTFIEFNLRFVGLETKYIFARKLNVFACIILLSFSYSPWFIKGHFSILSFPYWPEPGILLHFQFFIFSANVILAYILMFRSWKRSHGIAKSRFGFVFLAALIGFSGGVTNYFLWYHIPIPPFGNAGVAMYACVVAYAILKYQFLDIEVIIKRTLIFAGLSGFAMLVFSLTTYVINNLFASKIGLDHNSITLSSLIIIALSSNTAYRFLENKTDRFLFQKKYDYQNLLKDAARGMAQVTDTDRLLSLIVHFLTSRMRLKSASILLLNADKTKFVLSARRGYETNIISITCTNPLIQLLNKTKSPISIDDLIRISDMNNEHELSKRSLTFSKAKQLIKYFEKINLSVAVPSITQEEMMGILLLGNKRSDSPYTNSDINTLDALAHDAAMAISNAKAFQNLKIAQQQIAEQEKLAAVGKLAADVSHEIRNPLTVVMGQAEYFLHKNASSLDEKTRKVLDLIVKHTKRQLDIANRLLKFSRKKEIKFEVVHISQPIEEAIEMAKHHMTDSKIRLTVDIESGLPHIQGDTNLLHEVFFNLINNSLQAMENTPGEIAVTAKLGKTNKEIVTIIADTGPGIPKENLKKIFDPFFTTKEKGTGLGLALCKDYIVRHGGSMEIQSKVGKGTSFFISLPVTNEKTYRSIKVSGV